jgi:hypothetical protein
MAEQAAEAGQPEAFAKLQAVEVARAVNFFDLGRTSSCPGGRAVSRCLASSKEYEGNPLLLQWHLFILVITQPYALLSPSNPSYRASACSAPLSAIAA